MSAAAALANLDIFEREGLNQHVRDNEGAFLRTLQKLSDLDIVGDIRGAGYFYGIELVKDKVTKETFDHDESERLLRGFLSKALFDAGLLIERQANAELKAGGSFVLNGFKSIDEEKLRGLPAKTLGQWNAQNWLAPIYAQIQSSLNWGNLVDLMAARKEAGID